jgi:hypothetical protein
MAEGEGLEPTRPKPPVFKTGALPIMLTLHSCARQYCSVMTAVMSSLWKVAKLMFMLKSMQLHFFFSIW